MPIIRPKQPTKKIQQRININSIALEEITAYCQYAGFEKVEEFFEEAALHVLSKDREFKEWKESQHAQASSAIQAA